MSFGSPRDHRSLERQIAEDEVVEINVKADTDTGSGVEKCLGAEGVSTTDPGFSLNQVPGSNSLGKPACGFPSRNVKQLTEHELADIPKFPRKQKRLLVSGSEGSAASEPTTPVVTRARMVTARVGGEGSEQNTPAKFYTEEELVLLECIPSTPEDHRQFERLLLSSLVLRLLTTCYTYRDYICYGGTNTMVVQFSSSSGVAL